MRNKKQVTMNLAAKKVKNHNVMFFRTDPEALLLHMLLLCYCPVLPGTALLLPCYCPVPAGVLLIRSQDAED